MAFTLGFHIVLVPLGVSWAVIALIANYRGTRHDDAVAGACAAVVEVHGGDTFGVAEPTTPRSRS
jgi:cytochrome d ubiquinol oxidase subunit I